MFGIPIKPLIYAALGLLACGGAAFTFHYVEGIGETRQLAADQVVEDKATAAQAAEVTKEQSAATTERLAEAARAQIASTRLSVSTQADTATAIRIQKGLDHAQGADSPASPAVRGVFDALRDPAATGGP